jgi:hypothetical protein
MASFEKRHIDGISRSEKRFDSQQNGHVLENPSCIYNFSGDYKYT